MTIDGQTEIIAHIGYPTHSFRSPSIYNPFFAHAGVNAVVVPFACRADHYPALLRSLFTLDNIRGALVTMPHKVSTVALLDEVSPAVRIAGACNAVRRRPDGRLEGEQFDGAGFVRGLQRRGLRLKGARALVVGCGGVGRAIAASLAAAQVAQLAIDDVDPQALQGLAERLQRHCPQLRLRVGQRDPAGQDLVVNATPLGMESGDPMPIDLDRLAPSTWVADVVLKADVTAFLAAARARGCPIQVGSDMLYEMIPAYLEYFGLPPATPELLRRLSGAEAADGQLPPGAGPAR